jgi:hypothetical protein
MPLPNLPPVFPYTIEIQEDVKKKIAVKIVVDKQG